MLKQFIVIHQLKFYDCLNKYIRLEVMIYRVTMRTVILRITVSFLIMVLLLPQIEIKAQEVRKSSQDLQELSYEQTKILIKRAEGSPDFMNLMNRAKQMGFSETKYHTLLRVG